MGKEKRHVNTKKSYEKNPTDVQDSNNLTEILQEIIGSFNERRERKSCDQ